MKMRFVRGVMIASAMGLVMSGGVAQATESTAPTGTIAWATGVPAPFAGARLDGAVFDGKVYILGFRNLDGTTDGSIWYYDIAAQQYVDTGLEVAIPVTNYTIAVLKDKKGTGLYTFGGRSATGETTAIVQVFYPATGTTKVLTKDSWPGKTPSGCTSLPATGVTVYKKKAYVLGGTSFSTSIPACTDDNSAEVWRFNPKAGNGKKWKAQPSLNVARGYVAAAVIGKQIYAVGGDLNTGGTLTAQATVESWKVGSPAWDDASYADLPQGCDETQAFGYSSGPLKGTVTIAGCGQWPNALPDTFQYDQTLNTWTPTGPLVEARRNHAAADIGTPDAPLFFVLGGYNSNSTAVLSSSETGTPGPIPGGAPLAPPTSRTVGKVPLF